MKLPIQKNPVQQFRLILITATVTILGVIGFTAIDAHDNSEVAVQPKQTTSQVAAAETVKEVASIESELAALDVESLDADLDASFDF